MSRREKILQMLQEDDSDPFLHYGLALEMFREDETQDGLNQLESLILKFPDYVPAYFQLGQKLASLQKIADAQKYLQTGISCAKQQGNQHAVGEMTEFLAEISQV